MSDLTACGFIGQYKPFNASQSSHLIRYQITDNYLQSKANSSVIEEVERKLALFPNKKKYTIQRVLISAFGAEKNLVDRAYFDNIITLENLFSD